MQPVKKIAFFADSHGFIHSPLMFQVEEVWFHVDHPSRKPILMTVKQDVYMVQALKAALSELTCCTEFYLLCN